MSLEILPNGDRPVDERPFSDVLHELSSGPIRATNVARLSDLGRADIKEFSRAWMGLDDETRIALVRQMDELAEERIELNFSRALRSVLDDDSAIVRQLAVNALWEDSTTELLDRLLTMLDTDPLPDVRAAAATALGRFADLAATDELDGERAETLRARLLDAATDPGTAPVIQRRALEAVGAFGNDEEVREALEGAYASEDQSLQASALFAMGRSHDTYWLDLLLGELAGAEAELRFEAARACGQLGHEDAIPELVPLGADEDTEVRHAAITALGQIGGRHAVRVLQRMAETADDEADAALIAEALEEAEATGDALGTGL
jgi:HEAT repeat protein